MEKDFDNSYRLPANHCVNQPLLRDATWIKASHDTGHEFEVRTQLPDGAVPYLKQRALRMRVGLGTCSNPSDITRQIFYGNTLDRNCEPTEKMMGLAAYMSTLDPNEAQNAVNVIDGGGNGGSSIYLIVWSPDTVALAFSPKGLVDEDGRLSCAIMPVDWRYMARICNVSMSRQGPPDLEALMTEALLRIPTLGAGRTAFYMPPGLRKGLESKPSSAMLLDPREIIAFRGVPVHGIDEMRDDEPMVARAVKRTGRA